VDEVDSRPPLCQYEDHSIELSSTLDFAGIPGSHLLHAANPASRVKRRSLVSLTPTIPLKGDLMKLEPQLISGASGRRSIHQAVGKWRTETVDAVKSGLQNERCAHGGTAWLRTLRLTG
jgi:hypothetical protein